MSPTKISSRRHAQEGFTLAALIVILTIISIIIAFTVPEQWSVVLKRERDRQTIFLMKQFARSIMTFEVRHSASPTSLQQLQDARQPRVIRGGGKWPCPLTGKVDDWILVPPTAVQQGQVGQITITPPTGSNPATNPTDPATNPQATSTAPFGSTGTKLIPEASPKDYTGPFVAVRPNVTGKSYVAFNGVEEYDQWVYTVQDLRAEIQMRQQALTKK
jgi:type II secretory pathway pseudopilin PulG